LALTFSEKLCPDLFETEDDEPEFVMGLLEWTREYRAFLAEDKPLDFETHPYLVDLYDLKAQRAVVSKAAQLGVSEWAVSYAIHAADQRRANVLYIFPSERTISDFSAARIAPAIEASPYLTGIVNNRDGGRRGVDQTQLKRIRNRHLYLRGGMVKPDGRAPQLKSIDADVLIMDEFDEMDVRAPFIAAKRLGHSQIAEERMISTPSYPGMGVHAAFLQSDQRYWFVTCEHCGRKQRMTMAHLIKEVDALQRPTWWNGINEGIAYLACEKCGQELNRLGKGEWIAEHPSVPTAGFHMNKLFSPHVDLSDLIANLRTTDETKRKEAHNQDWGLPYKPKGGGIEDDILESCVRAYGMGVEGGERTVMGIDVGAVLHVVIRGPEDKETGVRPLRFAGTVDEFEDVATLARRYRTKTIVVDANPETREARRFQEALGRNIVWLAYYSLNHQGMKTEEPLKWNEEGKTLDVDRTRLMDEVVSRFVEQSNILPADAKNVPDYYKQLKAPVRLMTTRGSTGIEIAHYVETGPDHYFHAEVYCALAGMRPVVTRGTRVLQGRAKGW